MREYIDIHGARAHNLKNVNVKIPRNQLVVITGLSGSGKSSLAFDTIYAEGQRRYVESLSAYARQFLGVMDKPDVDHIDGLSPAICIDQKTASHNPRSTVGTITEVYDYLRLLYARIGVPVSPVTGKPLKSQTVDEMIAKINQLSGDKVMILAPQITARKGEHRDIIERIAKDGFSRIRLDGKIVELESEPKIKDKNQRHTIEIVIDRLTKEKDAKFDRTRLADSIEKALRLGDGHIIVFDPDKKHDTFLSEKLYDPATGMSFPDLEPRLFSFNSPQGACPKCSGLGQLNLIDPTLIIPNPKLSVREGAIRPWAQATASPSFLLRILEGVAKQFNISLDKPIGKLPKDKLDIILYGSGDEPIAVKHKARTGSQFSFETTYEGVIPNLERRYRETDSDFIRHEIEKYMVDQVCPICHGERLRPEALAVKLGGKSIAELGKLPVAELAQFFGKLDFTNKEQLIGKQILKEVKERLGFLLHVGLPYLTLNRTANTLSGGEAQRVRLATQVGSGLSGVIYILDEPSIGLHQKDNHQLIETLYGLRELGNSVLVVEHDKDMIMSADYVIDLGPGAGKLGGKIIAEGTPKQIEKNPDSITGQYLSGRKSILMRDERRQGNGKKLTIKGASAFNLQNIDVDIPLGEFICVTGLSGSGKSTLINEILAKDLSHRLHGAQAIPGAHKEILGVENLDKVIVIDQSAIGRTPRSNPATYTGMFGSIRDLFVQLPEAKSRGFQPGRFSFNVRGGRCENCQGEGVIKIEMHFLPDVYVPCEVCHGARYNQETLAVTYREKNIADVLKMTVDEALEFFINISPIANKLQTLKDVGLGYIELGQPATELSGGEAQRIKLATELSRRATGRTLYILDEPTTGLHFEDIKRLMGVLHRLVDMGNTVLVIEHNLDVIKTVDWIIDLGPEGGDKGGKVVATGTPEDVAKVKESYTGQYLKKELK